MSDEAVDLISKLLDRNPLERLGANGAKEIMKHPFFGDVDWSKMNDPEEFISDLPDVTKRSLM